MQTLSRTAVQPRPGFAARAGRWSARNRAKAIAGWLVFVIVAAGLGSGGLQELTTTETLTGESAAASRALDRGNFERRAGEQVLVQVRGADGSVRAPEGRAGIAAVARAVRSTGRAVNVHTPLEPGRAGQFSGDGRSALVLFDMKGKADTAYRRVGPVLAAVAGVARAHPALRIEQFGSASAGKALKDTVEKDFSRAEAISVPLTFGMLLVVFGAVLAAFVPLVLALTAVLAGTGVLALASHAIHADSSSSTMLLLIGLAVGVDYSLFYIRRAREERAGGRGPLAAIDVAAATSGRSVLISGLTVMVAMAGMFLTGVHTFAGMAEATIIVVAIAIIGSLTVLPATLSLLGDRIEKGRIPWFGKRLQRRRDSGPSRLWSALGDRVLRRPRATAVLAAGLLLVMAVPVVGLHTGQLSATQELPGDLAIMRTYDHVQHAFPGGPQPAQVVVSGTDVSSPAVTHAIVALRAQALASKQMFDPITVEANRTHTVARVLVPLAGDGQDRASRHALAVLRDRIVPRTVGAVATVAVGGSTASSVDFNATLSSHAPAVFAFVLALAFILLLVSFRSVVIAITGVALNLLSVGAAYGILVAVFQWGWGSSVLALSGTGAITSWLPLFLFVILFGLSMDYHVFSVSRIKENHDLGMPTRAAIHDGIARSAGVITSAAMIMVLVFLTFATLHQTSLKQLGVGLAAAVLIDATVVRAVLLPAVMAWLGERNWAVTPRVADRARSRPAPSSAA